MDEIGKAAIASGRNPNDVQLLAVTKGIASERVSELYELGHRDFGENRLPDAFEKMEQAPPDCRWHFIGTLQTKKVRKAVGRFVLIHSVDSPDLLSKIASCSKEAGVVTHVLLQINTSGEVSKHGMTPQEFLSSFSAMDALEGVAIEGLMTMAPLADDESLIRECFAKLRLLRDSANETGPKRLLHHLSMGMSHDFKIAIAEGATLVRIGSALF
jgi:hypothetical protein